MGRVDGLEPYRRRLDDLDERIVSLLGERFEVCREIARFKKDNDIPMMQPDRVSAVRERYVARGAQHALPDGFAGDVFELLIAATCAMEDELMAAQDAPEAA